MWEHENVFSLVVQVVCYWAGGECNNQPSTGRARTEKKNGMHNQVSAGIEILDVIRLHVLEVLLLTVLKNESNTSAVHQLVVHQESSVGYFPPTSSTHLNNIQASKVRTVKVPNRLQVMRNGFFVPCPGR